MHSCHKQKSPFFGKNEKVDVKTVFKEKDSGENRGPDMRLQRLCAADSLT